MQGKRQRVRGPTLLATGVGRLRVRTRQSVLAEEPSRPDSDDEHRRVRRVQRVAECARESAARGEQSSGLLEGNGWG